MGSWELNKLNNQHDEGFLSEKKPKFILKKKLFLDPQKEVTDPLVHDLLFHQVFFF